jgi:hypothetical protein
MAIVPLVNIGIGLLILIIVWLIAITAIILLAILPKLR